MPSKASKRLTADPHQMQQVLRRAIELHQAGNLTEAERGYAKVLKTFPAQPDALNLSGLIAHQQGKSARAVVLLQKAVAARPGFADALNHLGMARRKLGQSNEASAAFAAAVAADRDHAEAHNNLGNARKDEGDLSGAAASYEKACALAPRAVEPRYNLGNVLRDLENHAGAMVSYSEVLERAPNHVEARLNLAALRERGHELDLALADLDKVLSVQSGLAPAHILKSKVLRRMKHFEEAEAALQKLAGAQFAPEDAINFATEQGKLFDLTDRAGDAFRAFAEANRLQAETGGGKWPQQAATFRTQVAKELAWLQALESWPHAANDQGEGLVFLVGFPRSGTTLLDQVLDAHPEVAVVEERPAAARLLAEAKSMRLELPEALLTLDQGDATQLRAAYFAEVDQHVDRQDARVLVDKMPLNIVHILPLAKLFPRAKYVLAVRHPLDVILSNFMQLFRLNGAMANFLDLDTAAETYDLVMRMWQVATEKLPLSVHQVHYESLIADVEGEARKLLDFLGVEWTDRVLDPTGHARGRKLINTPSYEQVAEPIYQRANGRWLRYEVHLQPVRERLDPWVERLGY